MRASLFTKFFSAFLFIVTVVGVASSIGGYKVGVSQVGELSRVTSSDAQISGEVAFNHQQLKELFEDRGITAFWAGKSSENLYTITVEEDQGAVYLRYLPSDGFADSNWEYSTVIATYSMQDAYESTKARGAEINGIVLENQDKTQVLFYDKNNFTNVYLAFAGKPFQIEIYDPRPGEALRIANELGKIKEFD